MLLFYSLNNFKKKKKKRKEKEKKKAVSVKENLLLNILTS